MKIKIAPAILLFGITVILASSSFHAFDSKFIALAQTLDDSSQGPIPEDNYTDTNTGPIPEDNTTDPSMTSTPIDNSTDMQSLSPSDNNTFPLDNMTMPENNMPPASTPTSPFNSTSILPPLEQVKSGIHANEIQCKQGFVLVIKAEDGSPACVYSQVAQILIQRGW